MLILALAWLALLVAELVWGRSPLLEVLGLVCWLALVFDFVLKLVIAPAKLAYLRENWLGLLSLALPALRLLRLGRALRAARAIRLVRFAGSLNRGIRALGASFGRRGFGYVVALTTVVTLAGAAGMYAIEREVSPHFDSYGEALWWTAMIMTTMGSQDWPQTLEGRLLCLFLALYAFAVFGYVTAALATYFVGREASGAAAHLASAQAVRELRADIRQLRAELGRRSGSERG